MVKKLSENSTGMRENKALSYISILNVAFGHFKAAENN